MQLYAAIIKRDCTNKYEYVSTVYELTGRKTGHSFIDSQRVITSGRKIERERELIKNAHNQLICHLAEREGREDDRVTLIEKHHFFKKDRMDLVYEVEGVVKCN